MGSERSIREDIASCITARVDDGLHLIMEEYNADEQDMVDGFNTMPDGTARTIKSQYYKTSAANLLRQGSMEATGAIEANDVGVVKAGELRGTHWNGKPHQRNVIYGTDGLCPTIYGQDGAKNTIKIMEEEPKIVGYTRSSDGKSITHHLNDVANTVKASSSGSQAQYVYEPTKVIGSAQKNAYHGDVDGVSPTVTAACGMGGGQIPMIVEEPQVLRMERTEEEKQRRRIEGDAGAKFSAAKEWKPRQDGVSNTITTLQKDNLLVEPAILQVPHGDYRGGEHKACPSITSSAFTDNNYLKEPTEQNRREAVLQDVRDMVNGKRGGAATAELEADGTIRGCYDVGTHYSSVSEMVIEHDVNPALTVTSARAPKVYGTTTGYRIRKLTPREVFRLMDCSDEDIDKIQAAGISKTQQYKMAGNSICVQCLYEIFKALFFEPAKGKPRQLELF